MSEAIRKLTALAIKKNLTHNFSSVVALKTSDKIYAIDYWLSNFENSVKVLQDRMILTPYFTDERYKVKDQKINIDYFEILVMIGEGGFSKVYLGKFMSLAESDNKNIARRKDNGQFYAIKVILKQDMIKKGKTDAVFKERDIMTKLEHPFIVKLHFAFSICKPQLFLAI